MKIFTQIFLMAALIFIGWFEFASRSSAANKKELTVVIPIATILKNDSLLKIETALLQQKHSLHLIDSVLIEKAEKAGFEESMKLNSKVRRNQFTQDSIGWQLDTLRMKHIALFQPLMKKSK